MIDFLKKFFGDGNTVIGLCEINRKTSNHNTFNEAFFKNYNTGIKFTSKIENNILLI